MMHAKTDSEVTSLAPSSPARSPRRPAYYVQSPSRDSHDGEKSATSFHSSPAGSPPRSHSSSVGRHSRESSTSRFSGSLKPGSRKISPNAAGAGGRKNAWKNQPDAIDEEGLLGDNDDDETKGIPRRCYAVAFVLGFFVLFSFFALVLWGASRNQRPVVTIKSIEFENFVVQAGTDASMVPTDMSTMNSTLKMTFHNKGTFFGVHVSSSPITLNYYQLTLATGNMEEFYEARKRQRTLTVAVAGRDVPLYGGGAALTSTPPAAGPAKSSNPNAKVPLTLSFTVRSRAYVLGKLVKPKFYTNVQCSVVLDQSKLNKPVSLSNSCKYS